MPTFNQLVKQGRKSVAKKSNSPALQYTYNSLKKKSTESASPQKRVRLPEFVFLTVLR